MALYRALALGVGPHGGKIKPGTVFEYDGAPGWWMEPVQVAEPEPAPAAEEEPEAETIAEPRKRARKGAE